MAELIVKNIKSFSFIAVDTYREGVRNLKFYLFDEQTIIASKNKEEAELLYQKEYDDGYNSVEEIQDDYIVGAIENHNSYSGDYSEIILSHIIDKKKELPYIVDVDLN